VSTRSLGQSLMPPASKRDLVARERPLQWTRPSMFRSAEVLTEAEVMEAEAELKDLQRHAFELVGPKVGN
jgi:hypothetical protein